MSEYLASKAELVSIASAIRQKYGLTANLEYPQAFEDAILRVNDNHGSYFARTMSGDVVGQASSIAEYAFYGMSQITGVSYSQCLSIGRNAFYGCSSLVSADFPVCTYIDNGAFYNCVSLATVSFPLVQSVAYGAFRGTSNLLTVSLPACQTINYDAFESCNTRSLYLSGSTYVTMSGVGSLTTVFDNTPLSAGGTGKIYVPASMLATYKTMTGWSTISARLVSR